MNALTMDTHKFVRRLRDAGFEERQAEALVEGLGEMDTAQLATEADLKEATGLLRADLKSDIAQLRNEMSDLRTEMWKMQFTTIAASTALIVGILKLFP